MYSVVKSRQERSVKADIRFVCIDRDEPWRVPATALERSRYDSMRSATPCPGFVEGAPCVFLPIQPVLRSCLRPHL
jgi:hypothetical protein